jgi:hypothetical protein
MSHLTYDDARIRHQELIQAASRRRLVRAYRRANRLTARARLADTLRTLALRLDSYRSDRLDLAARSAAAGAGQPGLHRLPAH